MQSNPTSAIVAQGRNMSHHQSGVDDSTMTETLSVIQLNLRSFATNGSRWSSGGVSRVTAGSAISDELWVPRPYRRNRGDGIAWRRQSFPRQASEGWDCGYVRGTTRAPRR